MENKTSQPISLYRRYDPLYKNVITLSMCAQQIIEHPVFDRLSKIKQLGTLCFKMKHADHSRYVHSIGVAYLARFTALHLQKQHPSITDREVLCVELAGLCHDLGHGAYSHTFDHMLHDLKINHKTSKHEARSMILFDYICGDLRRNGNEHMDLTNEEIKLVQYLIDTKIYKTNFAERKYKVKEAANPNVYPPCVATFYHGLEQIVSNSVYNLDVDKLDYLERDASALRFDQTLNNNLNVLGILERTRIVDSRWMIDIRDQGAVYDLICRRQLFYSNCYVLPDVALINCMFNHAVIDFNKCYDIANCSRLENDYQIREFCNLTDDILLEFILNCNDRSLDKAKQLLTNIISGENLYEHVGDFPVDGKTKSDDFSFSFTVFNDKSSPTNLLPKVLYHNNGKKSSHNVQYVRIFRPPNIDNE